MDCSLPGSSVHGIFQARVLEWGAIAFSVLPANGSETLHGTKVYLKAILFYEINGYNIKGREDCKSLVNKVILTVIELLNPERKLSTYSLSLSLL